MKTILIIDDQKLIRDSLKLALKDEGYKAFAAKTGKEGLDVLKKENADLILLDLKLPDSNGIDVLKQIKTSNPDSIVIMMTGYGTIENAVAAMKLGAFDYINKPFKSKHISTIIKLALETQKLQKEVNEFRKKAKSLYETNRIIGNSKEIQAVQNMITKVSQSGSSTVLIQGESGTGKELVAKAIHYSSPRLNGPFIEINCSAIPYSLLESELFGYEQGAFTDAKRTRKGLFEQSDGGTLFLDEIGDMDLAMQSKLLNVLQEKKFRRLGGYQTIQVNARIIASTNHNLRDYVRLNKFREDLYYRLNVLSICLPPLRERKEDIILIAKHFIEILNQDYRKKVQGIDEDAANAMINYSWPGNVRELRNTIERIMIIDGPEVISVKNLPREIIEESCPEPQVRINEVELPDSGIDLKELALALQTKLIKQALLKAKGNKTEAARLLNLDRFALRYLINKNKAHYF
ncbi:MAG TPA: sigma-54 dependent transcriptional regulator [Syntrophales bacterium]|nr:sigma-54 dependent transcriptional regulator [Syntrophales bacterium]